MQHNLHRSGSLKSATRLRAAGAVLPSRTAVALTKEIVIPHRTAKLTQAALEYAGCVIAETEYAAVRLIDVRVVPYGVPLRPPLADQAQIDPRLRRLVKRSDLPVSIEIVYTRRWEQGFRRALNPHSLVLIPTRQVSPRSDEKRMANRLRRTGHEVAWVEPE